MINFGKYLFNNQIQIKIKLCFWNGLTNKEKYSIINKSYSCLQMKKKSISLLKYFAIQLILTLKIYQLVKLNVFKNTLKLLTSKKNLLSFREKT